MMQWILPARGFISVLHEVGKACISPRSVYTFGIIYSGENKKFANIHQFKRKKNENVRLATRYR